MVDKIRREFSGLNALRGPSYCDLKPEESLKKILEISLLTFLLSQTTPTIRPVNPQQGS